MHIFLFAKMIGDVDNRVRAIARQLGFKTVIWTSQWDTQDWQLQDSRISQKQVVGIFNDALDTLPDRETGVVTLEHDGNKKLTTMASMILDMGRSKGLRPVSIAQCLSDNPGYNEAPAKPTATTDKPDANQSQDAKSAKDAKDSKDTNPTSDKTGAPKSEAKETGDPTASAPNASSSNGSTPESVAENNVGSTKKTSGSNQIMSSSLSAACWTLAAAAVSLFI